MDHQTSGCWKCHDWVLIEVNGALRAAYCDTCGVTVDEWIMLQSEIDEIKPSLNT